MPDDGDANLLTVASVASSATSVTLLEANSLRAGFKVHNNSTAALYINETGAAASTSTGGYTVKVAADGYYETQPGLFVAGKVTAIWASANGGASVSEWT